MFEGLEEGTIAPDLPLFQEEHEILKNSPNISQMFKKPASVGTSFDLVNNNSVSKSKTSSLERRKKTYQINHATLEIPSFDFEEIVTDI